MPYSQFSIDKVKQDFHLKTVEGIRFFPDSIEQIGKIRLISAMTHLQLFSGK